MAVSWYKDSPKFFGLSTSSNENIETVEFESGKKRFFLKNSTNKKAFSFSFLITDSQDEESFWSWYENTLLSRTQTVNLTDLVTGSGQTEYRMTEEPSTSDSQFPKEYSVSVEEE